MAVQKKNHVTMRALAEIAGVSPMTVSYALRNHPKVSEETRIRIQELAKKEGYHVDPETSRCLSRVASRGRGVREAMGFLHFVENDREHDLHDIAAERAGQRGFAVDSLWIGQEGLELDRALDILHARGVRGMLLGNNHGQSATPLPDLGNMAAVELGQTHTDSGLPRVLGNHYGNARSVLHHLAALGYVRPGLICLRNQDEMYQGQLRAAFSLLAPQGKRALPVPLICETLRREEITSWIAAQQPDVIFTPCRGLKKKITSTGVRIPEDLGLVEYHDETGATPGVAAMQEDRKSKVFSAVDLVLGRVSRGEVGPADPPTHTLIDARWVPGQTIR